MNQPTLFPELEPVPPMRTAEFSPDRVYRYELTRIWDALKEPYRLSVCWKVTVTRIDSERQFGTGRVIERTGVLGPVPEQEAV